MHILLELTPYSNFIQRCTMGFFNFITDLFSKSGKKKPKKQKTAKKKAAPKTASSKNAVKKKSSPATGSPKNKKTVKKKAKQESTSRGILFSLNGKGKKRKKSEKISSDPIDEKALGFSISLKGEDEQAKKRDALRITVKGLTVYIPRLNKKFAVTDISATGLGFAFEKPRVKAGIKLKMDIHLKEKVIATEILCKVMRHARGSVGCVFIDLDRAQDDAVHEIVLLGQKQQAARKNAAKDRDFKLPA